MKCPFCQNNMLQPASLHITDKPGVQRKVEGGWVCVACNRIFVHTLGPEHPMDLTAREQEIKADAETRINGLRIELNAANEILLDQKEDIVDLKVQLDTQTELAETRLKMFDDMQAKFVDVNAKYQSLKDKKEA